MLCAEFEDKLTDYIDGALDAENNRAFAEHTLRCPVCHELLSEVRSSITACATAEVPAPSKELEARIMLATAPECEMSCEEFEGYLTDYLDGFLPASLYHRWERHAALCGVCTELPGQVVRSIGACYTYISEELPVPAGLHNRILQATLGTVIAEEVRPPFLGRVAAWLRLLLDPIVSPQFATVATMLLLSVMVLTNTVSADGSIGGMYRASLKLAEQTYNGSSATAGKSGTITEDVKKLADGITTLMSNQPSNQIENKVGGKQPAQPAPSKTVEGNK
jgi:anti-sigma factor RsiW